MQMTALWDVTSDMIDKCLIFHTRNSSICSSPNMKTLLFSVVQNHTLFRSQSDIYR